MPVITETKLNSDIKSGKFSGVYFFYGEEAFLTRTYVQRIKTVALGEDPSDINLLEMNGNPDLNILSDHVEALPFFSDYKVILINDFNPEKLTEEEADAFKELIKNVPDTTIVVFYLTDCSFSLRSEKMKNLFEYIKKYAAVCEFKPLNKMKIGELISKKVARKKRLISRTNAEYLAEITACDLTLASVETEKLCCYIAEGEEITRETIDIMVAKKLETKVFTLSDAIIAGNKNRTLKILNELLEQKAEPIVVLSTLASTFADYYYAKAANEHDIFPQQVASDFGYTGAKATFAARRYSESTKMNLQNLRDSIQIIFNADIKCKSTSIDKRFLLEKTILELIDKR